MRLGPPPEQEEAPGQFWIDFIHDTAPVFRKPTIEQLGEFVAPTFEALCDGARFVHARLLEIIDELQPDVIVEDNVVSFPALAASGGRWVRIVSCNPLEVPDPALPPVFSGYPAGRPLGVGSVRGGVPAHARRAACVVRRVPPRMRSAAAPGARVHGHLAVPQPLRLSRRGRLRARASARRDVAQRADERAHERAVAAPRAPARRAGSAAVPLARIARLGRRRADAAPRRHPRRDRAPRDRLQGPAGRADPAARQHVRRGLSAAAGDPAAGRSRDHPRRQQHDLRGAPSRQADGRAADLLGSVRQRAARARDRSRRAPGDVRVRGRGAHRRGRPPAGRRCAAAAARGHGAAACRAGRAPSRRPA